jgi:hypothetical protein
VAKVVGNDKNDKTIFYAIVLSFKDYIFNYLNRGRFQKNKYSFEAVFRSGSTGSTLGYNEFDFFLENKEYRPFDGCKIEI